MASDRQLFSRASEKYADHETNGRLSVSTDLGYVAIIISGYFDNRTQPSAFMDEAIIYSQLLLEKRQQRSKIITCTTAGSLYDIIKDPEAHSIVTIGNGSFSTFWLPQEFPRDEDDSGVEIVDWFDVSFESTHLKQGFWHQRSCGSFSRNLNVPLGMFALQDRSELCAFTNQAVTDKSPENHASLLRVFGSTPIRPCNTYEYVKKSFGQIEATD